MVDMDPFWCIAGVRPQKYLKVGQSCRVAHEDAKVNQNGKTKQHLITRWEDHYTCCAAFPAGPRTPLNSNCPAACSKYLKGESPLQLRTCPHLNTVLGTSYEKARLSRDPNAPHVVEEDVYESVVPKVTAGKRPVKADPGDAETRPKKRINFHDPFANVEEDVHLQSDEEEESDDWDNKRTSEVIEVEPESNPQPAADLQKGDDLKPGDLAASVAKVEQPKPASPAKPQGPALLLAESYNINRDTPSIKGYWMSEKLDGVRAFWDGKELISRTGDILAAPAWFKIIDAPSEGTLPFEQRMRKISDMMVDIVLIHGIEATLLHPIVHEACEGRDSAIRFLRTIEGRGGEGIMLRKPGSVYEGGRSTTLLKLKSFYDAEAEVIGYEAGKGRYEGVIGALVCKMACGKKLRCSVGLTDHHRKNPPKIGSLICYRFTDLTTAGLPLRPTFVGEAIDKDCPRDAEIRARASTSLKKDAF